MIDSKTFASLYIRVPIMETDHKIWYILLLIKNFLNSAKLLFIASIIMKILFSKLKIKQFK